MKQKMAAIIVVLFLAALCGIIYNSMQIETEGDNRTQKHEPSNSSFPAGIPSGLEVHFIDVGQGDSILVKTPNGKSLLIDAAKNTEGSKVVQYIKSQGIGKLDALVGTHPHEDHIGGMDMVVKAFDIGSIYMPKISTTTRTFKDLLNAIGKKGLKIDTAKAGVDIGIDKSVKISILAPNSSDYEELNDYSAVIKLTYNKTSFLLTGDAGNISEREMLSKGYSLKADVLKVGHHGSRTSTSDEFLKAVNPSYAVISVAESNEYGHPHKETLRELKGANIQILRTDESGTVIASSDGKTIKFRKSKP